MASRISDEVISLISPLAKASAELSNARWGLIMRTGNDKSHFARQIVETGIARHCKIELVEPIHEFKNRRRFDRQFILS